MTIKHLEDDDLHERGDPIPAKGQLVKFGARTSLPGREQAATGADSGGAWEQPLPFDDVGRLPEFPVGALPSAIGEWVTAIAESTQTPPDLAASMALAALSASVAKKFMVEVSPDWREPLSLFCVTAMLPGERKSAVHGAATQPIRDWEAAQSRAVAPHIRDALTTREIRQKAVRNAVERASKTGSTEDEELARQAAERLDRTVVPVVPRIVCDDTTPEKLAQLLGDHGGRMAVMSAEGGIFDTIGGRYSDGIPNLDVLLKGHAGDELRVDRINRASLHIRKPAITMGLCVQPSVLEGLAMRGSFLDRGLLGRFLFVLPQSRMGRRDVDPRPVAGAIAEAYQATFRSLLSLPETRAEDGEIREAIVSLHPEAREELRRFQAVVEPRLGPDGDLVPIRSWAAKLVGATVRIAGLIRLAEWAASSVGSVSSVNAPDMSVCGREVVERAIEIALYYLQHAQAAFRVMGADPNVAKARVLLSYLAAHTTHTTHKTKRDLHAGVRSSTFQKATDMDEPLALLQEHGYVRMQEQPKASGGGRPRSPLIELNPLVRSETKAR